MLTLLNVTVPKGQTRTDWSKRPLTREQLDYAADDVLYLAEVAHKLQQRLKDLGREQWVAEDCLEIEDRRLYEPDLSQSWARLRGIGPAAAGAARPCKAHRRVARKGRSRT